MLTLSTYYNSMYSEAVKRLASLYRETGEYEKMTEICQRASSYDLLDEELHYWGGCRTVRPEEVSAGAGLL